MRQLGLAFMQYTEDNDETYPTGVITNLIEPGDPRGVLGMGWAGIIYPYVKSTGAYNCPDDPTGLSRKNGAVIGYPVSYLFNTNAAEATLAQFNAPTNSVLLAEVRGDQALITDPSEGTNGYTTSAPSNLSGSQFQFSPAGDGLTSDITGLSLGTVSNIGPFGATFTSPDPYVKYDTGDLGSQFTVSTPLDFAGVDGRHTGGANFVAVDGHVKWLLPSHVSVGYNAPASDCTQNDTPPVADCNGSVSIMAAGTSNSNYSLTFSKM